LPRNIQHYFGTARVVVQVFGHIINLWSTCTKRSK
jgi:hypothetical protein